MSSTERRESGPKERDKERTRAAILAAAERVVSARGAGVSLAEIADEAGVTKSGLLHHFPSRAALMAGVVQHVTERAWDEVNALVESADDRPGAFTRAYVRASTGDSNYLLQVFGVTGLIARLGQQPETDQLEVSVAEDAARWNIAFEADGLPPGRVLAIRYAADGVLVGIGTPFVTDEQLASVRQELLALTEL